MAGKHVLAGLIKWSTREPWCDRFERVLEDHLLPTCDQTGLEFENIVATLGQDRFMGTVWACAFEDFLTQEFARKTLDEWDAYLRPLDVCYGRVNTLPEALTHENLRAAGMLPQDELGRTHIGPPIRFRAEPAIPTLREPAQGEHTAPVLRPLAAVPGE